MHTGNQEKKILIALHDVAPFHLHRLKRLENLLSEFNISQVNFLFVPDYHERGRSSADGPFVSWCRKQRHYRVTWFLHGYGHMESKTKPAGKDLPVKDMVKRRFLTDAEAEFLSLESAQIRGKIQKGKKIFAECLPGEDLAGFIAPAWLFNQALFPVLKEACLAFTEDHGKIYHVPSKKHWKCPVITWATRSIPRKYGSILMSPYLLWHWRNRPLLRIALHPFDGDHPEIMNNIKGVLKKALEYRDISGYNELCP